MPHFAVVVPPYVGHLRPMSVLARALVRRGHRVTMLSLHDSEPWLERAKLEFVIYGKSGFPPGEWNRRMAETGRMTGRQAAVGAVHLVLDQARLLVEELPGLLSGLKADGIVADQVCCGTECVALQTGLPYAVACNALHLHYESRVPPYATVWPYNPSLAARMRNLIANVVSLSTGIGVFRFLLAHRRRVGLPRARVNDFNEMPPSLAQVAQVPEFLDFPRHALPEHFHYTGPWKESGAADPGEFPWEQLDGRPLIYASLGSLQNRLDHLYRTIAEACTGLKAQLVIALGRPNESNAPNDFPGAPIVVPFAPQTQILERAGLVITHAGLNTALETLRAGVPMVCLPITNEQPGIAARLQRLGVARLIPLKRLTPSRLRLEVELLLTGEGYHERARSVAQRLQALDGPGMAAHILEAALVTRRKVMRAEWPAG